MSEPARKEVIATGKTKTLYATGDAATLLMEFRDDITASDGQVREAMRHKGAINNAFNTHLMQLLQRQGIAVHLKSRLNATCALVRKLQMIPLEAVVRNVASGSICRRLGLPDGMALNPPTFEFFYKDDDLGDPMVNESHAIAFGWASRDEMEQMRAIALRINQILSEEFARAGLLFVDSKVEFGRDETGAVVLGDELTPDGMRIWRMDASERLDKDRFRQGLGRVIESYREVAELLGVQGLPQ